MSAIVEPVIEEEEEDAPEETAPMDDWTLLRDVIWPKRSSSIIDN